MQRLTASIMSVPHSLAAPPPMMRPIVIDQVCSQDRELLKEMATTYD